MCMLEKSVHDRYDYDDDEPGDKCRSCGEWTAEDDLDDGACAACIAEFSPFPCPDCKKRWLDLEEGEVCWDCTRKVAV